MRCVRFLVPVLVVSAVLAAAGVTAKISPNTLVEGGPGTWVTVNTNIPYGSVDRRSLELSGVPVSWTKADARGELVAKFAQGDIEAIVAPPSATLVLTGLRYVDGEWVPFAAADTINVR